MFDKPWLTEEERGPVIDKLLAYNLIKYDHTGGLPLKGGGTTDTYLHLRNARSRPEALSFLGELYTGPIKNLAETQHLARFVEIPDSVSCFAGYLSILTNIPYITIRETPKTGRVAKAKVIGEYNPGETVAIIDDVITDGESKIIPYRECLAMGLKTLVLIVLVDRRQGWQEKFRDQGIDLKVWAGMTLNDIRDYMKNRA